MKTLVYCTAYASNRETWDARYSWWIKSVCSSALHFDQLLIVDDGSASQPNWPGMEIIREEDCADPQFIKSDARILFYRFSSNLGRAALLNFPGWHRSFTFGAIYGKRAGFTKIIHLESDAHLTSVRIQRHINAISEGWIAMWADKYEMPELAIQIIAGKSIDDCIEFSRRPYSDMVGRVHESIPPYTHIECTFRGDRYGEHLIHVPADADYSAQVQQGREADYYWWIKSDIDVRNRSGGVGEVNKSPAKLLDIGLDDVAYGRGWSYPEAGYRWAVGFDSWIIAPSLGQIACALEFDVVPFIYDQVLFQRLIIVVNGFIIGEFRVLRSTHIRCEIPAHVMNNSGNNTIRIMHPDAKSPFDCGASDDRRELAIAVSGFSVISD